ncbi:hypothetical protein OsJ_32199 [Oryza sativa Japonica Group]|uniref:Uncharacterized protein n=1 Tax=Oryza sativa subsp. japonica TaxID=39947 RepID=B9G6P0_ORYSJ|nr:hypothetical protein OsJ_32199 [Oryza sativa Japonica Group]
MPLLARAPPPPPPLRHRGRLLPRFTSSSSPRRRRRPRAARVRASGSDPPPQQQQQQVNLSVLRFTLGNNPHSPSSAAAASWLRSEALGLCLAAFSATLPYLGRFLEGAGAAERVPLPEGSRQVFAMSDSLSAAQKEDMAWASYVLLRNTNTTSVLISIGNQLCIRGYWDPPEDISKYAMIEWFKSQMQEAGIVDLREDLYFPTFSDTQLGKLLPQGILSVLAQPVLNNPDPTNSEIKAEGFILLASNSSYAYSEKHRVWIRTVANKFQCT